MDKFLVKNGYSRCTFTEVITKLKLRYHFLDHSFTALILTAVDRWRHQWCPTTTRQVIGHPPDCYQHRRRNVMKSGTAQVHGERGSASL